jgi:hypothetical protein
VPSKCTIVRTVGIGVAYSCRLREAGGRIEGETQCIDQNTQIRVAGTITNIER